MSENKKTVIVYKTKYGSTKRYAEWIAEELKADIFERSKITLTDLLKYDTIVYGGSVYMAGILGISLIRKNFDKLRNKKVVVFSVGASPVNFELLNEVKNKNFTSEMKEKIHYFHLRGGFDLSKLNPVDKLLMSLLKEILKRKKEEELADDQKSVLALCDSPADWTDKKNNRTDYRLYK